MTVTGVSSHAEEWSGSYEPPSVSGGTVPAFSCKDVHIR